MIKQVIKEETSNGDFKVVYVDRNYNQFEKKFKNDPSGPPENARKRAEKFKKDLESKDEKSSHGLYRSIEIKMI